MTHSTINSSHDNPPMHTNPAPTTSNKPTAVVLLSGGLDSATCLAWAQQRYYCICISFRYGQRHVSELNAAIAIAKAAKAQHTIIDIDLASIGGSSLTDSTLAVPTNFDDAPTGIPSTYVPARNTIFLSYALAVAEVTHASAIVIGVNAVDYSGYPDCRPEYIQAFQTLANLATKTGVEGQELTILTPLLLLSKADIIGLGNSLGVNYAATVSCYQATEEGLACGKCDSCRLRKLGFEQANLTDPTRYS